MVAKSWGRAISGPVLGVCGLGLLAVQQIMHDPKDADFVRDIGWVVLGIAGLMVIVAQFDVWREEHLKRFEAFRG